VDRIGQIRSVGVPDDRGLRFVEADRRSPGEAPAAFETLEEGLLDATAVLAPPEKYRGRLRTTNMLERLIQEIRRREKVIRIFPNKASAWRLVGALLAEKHEEWSTGRRYWTMDEFYQWREQQVSDDTEDLQPESSNRTLQPA
jgi:transposase-like protein